MIPLTPDTPATSWFAKLLNNLPIPQTKIALGVVCTLGTFVWAWVDNNASEGVLATLLTFCSVLFGISHFDYKTKRLTDLDYQHGEVKKIEAAQPTPVGDA
jgi:hypothetical protein